MLKNLKIGQKLFLGFGAVTLLMVIVTAYSYYNFTKASQVVDLNLQTNQIIKESDDLFLSLTGMESSARGYALAGSEDFLEPFNQGKANYNQLYSQLVNVTSDNSLIQGKLLEVNSNYQSWLDWETSQLIDGRQKVDTGQEKMEDLIYAVQLRTGKKYMDSIKTSLDDILQEEQRLREIRVRNLAATQKQTSLVMISGVLVVGVLAFIVALWFIRIVVNPVRVLTTTFKEISEGEADLDVRLKAESNDELGQMAKFFNIFMIKLKAIIEENNHKNWLKTGQTELSAKIRGDLDLETLGSNIISFITKFTDAQIGAVYHKTDDNNYKLFGSYAYADPLNKSKEFKLGEGLVGQTALEKQTIVITNVPDDYIKISSGAGEAVPRNILVTPCIYNNEVKCIIELGSFNPFTDMQIEFIELISEAIAMTINSAEARSKMRELLDKTLEQKEELQVQQEELQQSNEELAAQTKALQVSEQKLQAQQQELRQNNHELENQANNLRESEARLATQQEELQVINQELQERTDSLEKQKNDIAIKNVHLNKAQKEIEEKAKALEAASKYKSEFLANMSHELRTPLNSILLLSQLLATKKDNQVLNPKELEFAKTIYSSGQDLLNLINDILDLSKVEAGKMDVDPEKIAFAELAQQAERSFRPVALQKKLDFRITMAEDMPEFIVSDKLRIQQIVNNLLSNAFKFTQNGEVTLTFARPYIDMASEVNCQKSICIIISDTGLGIPLEKQSMIFEAFKQSDGTTSRKYGGTGLGLSISRELAGLLGGRIHLVSEEGKGSIFTLVLPENLESAAIAQTLSPEEQDFECSKDENVNHSLLKSELSSLNIEKVNSCQGSDKRLLIIEDDKKFTKILNDLAQEKGYKCIFAEDGKSGIELAVSYKPKAILLDIGLPDISGWKVIEQLQENPATRNILVHVISGGEFNDNALIKLESVIGYLKKPIGLNKLNEVFYNIEKVTLNTIKRVLILDSNREYKQSITHVLGTKGIQIISVDTGEDAFNIIKTEQFDCIILDLDLKDMSGLDFLKQLRNQHNIKLPVIIHTDKGLTQDEESELQKYAESIILKGSRSVERLVDEAKLFLHDLDYKLEGRINNVPLKLDHNKENSLKNKKILIVDDDPRNVFALTNVLEGKGIQIIVGRNGKEGIEKLRENKDVDLILMDIMMPEIDGFSAMRTIREREGFSKLPIIALTAKAMKGDRLKCIEAGASDYLSKPIDIDKLIALLRVWLYK